MRKKKVLLSSADIWHPEHGRTSGDVNNKHNQQQKPKRRYTPSGLPLPPKASRPTKKSKA